MVVRRGMDFEVGDGESVIENSRNRRTERLLARYRHYFLVA